jgi:hypothetical protein
MSGPPGSLVEVSVEGQGSPGGADVNPKNQVSLNGARLYKIVNLDKFMSSQTLTLTFPSGVTVNAFTFGS